MGYLSEPPKEYQLAAAQDFLFSILEAARLAQTMMISKNLKLSGTIGEQEAFVLVWSEIRGVAARALAAGTAEAAKAARVTVNDAVDKHILKNPTFDKFKVGVAGSDDPLLR